MTVSYLMQLASCRVVTNFSYRGTSSGFIRRAEMFVVNIYAMSEDIPALRMQRFRKL